MKPGAKMDCGLEGSPSNLTWRRNNSEMYTPLNSWGCGFGGHCRLLTSKTLKKTNQGQTGPEVWIPHPRNREPLPAAIPASAPPLPTLHTHCSNLTTHSPEDPRALQSPVSSLTLTMRLIKVHPYRPRPVSPTPGRVPDPLGHPISPGPEDMAPSSVLSQDLVHTSAL